MSKIKNSTFALRSLEEHEVYPRQRILSASQNVTEDYLSAVFQVLKYPQMSADGCIPPALFIGVVLRTVEPTV